MEKTTHSKLNKPEKHEFFNIDDLNANADIIDKELKQVDTISSAVAGKGKIYFLRRCEDWAGKVYLYAYKSGEPIAMYQESSTEMKTDDGNMYYCDRPSDDYTYLIFHSEHISAQNGFPYENYATLPPRGLYHTPVYVQTTGGTEGFWADQLTQTRKIILQGEWGMHDYTGWTFEIWAKNWSDPNRKKYPLSSLGFINTSDTARVRYFAADIPIDTDDFYFSWKNAPDAGWNNSDTYLISGLKDGDPNNYLGEIPVWYGLSNERIDRSTGNELFIDTTGTSWDACYVNAFTSGAASVIGYADLIDPHSNIYVTQYMKDAKYYNIGNSEDDLTIDLTQSLHYSTPPKMYYVSSGELSSSFPPDIRVDMRSFKGETDERLMLWWSEYYQIDKRTKGQIDSTINKALNTGGTIDSAIKTALKNTGSGSFTSVALAGNSGTFYYSKVGNMVTLSGSCITNGMYNSAVFIGLPFVSKYCSEIVQFDSAMASKFIHIFTGNIDDESSTKLYIKCVPSQAGDYTNFKTDGKISFTITYITEE